VEAGPFERLERESFLKNLAVVLLLELFSQIEEFKGVI